MRDERVNRPGRIRSHNNSCSLRAASVWLVGRCDPVTAQTLPTQQYGAPTQQYSVAPPPLVGGLPPAGGGTAGGPGAGPGAPPLYPPPGAGALPSGSGTLSLGDWLFTPTLGFYTLYNSNIYSSATSPLAAPAFTIAPSLLAEYNAGLYDTKIYGNISSSIYPTLDPSNNTLNAQVGFTQIYTPLPDLAFTLQGNAAHATTLAGHNKLAPDAYNLASEPAPAGCWGRRR